jgi:pimeloyl-ACP methyl ester carboxylesterase
VGIVEWPGAQVALPTGRRLHVRRAASLRPDAPPAVAVHGLGGSSLNWTALMGELRDVVDFTAPDLPGFGASPPGGRHTIADYVADVSAYLERFGEPVHLIGNSMGGMICVLVASSRPDLVATLCLVSPAMPQYRLPSAARAMAFVALPRLGEVLISRVNGVPVEDQVRRLARVMYADPDSIDAEQMAFAVAERQRRMQQPYADTVLLAALRSIVGHYLKPPRRSAWEAARRIMCPVLVMLSARDPLVGSSGAGRWRRTLPKARVVHLPSSGHVAMMEHPRAVADLIRSVVTVAPRAGGVQHMDGRVRVADGVAGNAGVRGTVGD